MPTLTPVTQDPIAANSAASAIASASNAAISAANAVTSSVSAANSAGSIIGAVSSTAANAASSATDAVATAADRVQTALDVVATAAVTNADVALTHADVVLTNADASSTTVDAADAAASQASASASKASAASSASSATASATSAATSEANAVAVVTGGTASLTPAAGLIPLADANGEIANWMQKGLFGNIMAPLVHIPFKRQDDEVALSGLQTFTRVSTGTYIDPLDGLVKAAAIDTPRFERMADGGTGILLEGASTNLCRYSQDFTNAAWNKYLGCTIPVSASPSPDGTLNATTVTFNGTPSGQLNQNIVGLTVGVTYTLSAYIKNTILGATFTCTQVGSGGIPYTTWLPTDNWARQTITFTATATSAIFYFVSSVAGSMDVWGCQIEALPFASSYIPTTTAAVTRAADKLSLALSGNMSSMYNVSVIADCDFFNIASLKYQGILDSGGGNRFVFHTLANGTFQNYAGQSLWGGSISPDTVTRLAISNNATKRSYQDGVLVTSISNQNTYEPSNLLLIGRFFNNTFPMYGHIRNFRIYDQALTASEIAAA